MRLRRTCLLLSRHSVTEPPSVSVAKVKIIMTDREQSTPSGTARCINEQPDADLSRPCNVLIFRARMSRVRFGCPGDNYDDRSWGYNHNASWVVRCQRCETNLVSYLQGLKLPLHSTVEDEDTTLPQNVWIPENIFLSYIAVKSEISRVISCLDDSVVAFNDSRNVYPTVLE